MPLIPTLFFLHFSAFNQRKQSGHIHMMRSTYIPGAKLNRRNTYFVFVLLFNDTICPFCYTLFFLARLLVVSWFVCDQSPANEIRFFCNRDGAMELDMGCCCTFTMSVLDVGFRTCFGRFSFLALVFEVIGR
jgi:hypothetical protein